MRFSLFTLAVTITVLAVSLKLNTLQRRTVYMPEMTPSPNANAGLTTLQIRVVEVHYDVGWPIWYARHIDVFAPHNAALYLDQDRRDHASVPQAKFEDLALFDLRNNGPLNLVPNYFRAVFNVFFATALGLFLAAILRWVSRLVLLRTEPRTEQ